MLAMMALVYGVLDVGVDPVRLGWTAAVTGMVLGQLTVAAGLIGGTLWGLEYATSRRRSRRPGFPEFRLYAAIGACAVFALLLFRLYTYAYPH
jgi:hypothetical protein